MAIQVENPKCTFIHLEKNGGTSISQWMQKNCKGYRLSLKHGSYQKLKSPKKNFGDLGLTFAVVRNPWDRVVSAYAYQTRKDQKRILKTTGVNNEIPDFKTWLKTIISFSHHYILTPQHPKIDGVDLVLRYEKLSDEFKQIQEFFNCHEPLDNINASAHKNYQNYYDEETKDIISDVYQIDIEKYDYRF